MKEERNIIESIEINDECNSFMNIEILKPIKIFHLIVKFLIIILAITFAYKLPPIDRWIEKFEISLQSFTMTKRNIKVKAIEKDPNFKYFTCFCSMGREENLYVRELISYYLDLGVEKFIFGDNNLKNTEKLSDVLQDYINKGMVDIIDLIGNSIGQAELFGIIYEKYKSQCQWLSFFDFDEYLVIYNKKDGYLSLQEYLTNSIFNQCDAILFNWLMYGDNDYSYYDKRPLIQRFTTPDYENPANKFVKSIIRGNLKGKIFGKYSSNHIPKGNLRFCNSEGKEPFFIKEAVNPPNFKNAFLMHFNTKTAEEYSNKIKRGYPSNYKESPSRRLNLFFHHNRYSRKKFRIFQTKLNITLK